jgi:hypothetical protein
MIFVDSIDRLRTSCVGTKGDVSVVWRPGFRFHDRDEGLGYLSLVFLYWLETLQKENELIRDKTVAQLCAGGLSNVPADDRIVFFFFFAD